LKLLKADAQAELAAVCSADGLEAGRKHARARWNVSVALSTISDWFGWYQLQQRFTSAASRAKQVEEMLKAGQLSTSKIAALGQAIFEMEALEASDASTYLSFQKLKLDQESAKSRAQLEKAKLALQERRVVVMEKNMQEAVSVAKDTTLSTEEQAKRIREILGKE